jgi:hypothetical protein
VYQPCQITREFAWSSRNLAPAYPPLATRGKIAGLVRVQFVVNRRGIVDLKTLKVFTSPHQMFTEAVRGGLRKWRATLARLGEIPVDELAAHDFLFVIPDSGRACPAVFFAAMCDTSIVCPAPTGRAKALGPLIGRSD